MDLLLLYDSIGLLISGYREASHLAAVLKEMKEGLDAVRGKVQALTAKVLDSLSDDSQIHVFFFLPGFATLFFESVMLCCQINGGMLLI